MSRTAEMEEVELVQEFAALLGLEVDRAVAKFPDQALRLSDAEWLLSEIERLRKVEQAARDVIAATPECFICGRRHGTAAQLMDALGPSLFNTLEQSP